MTIWHFKFPKVVQAHALGEVGILGIILLRVYSETLLPIFIEIGSYLTDKEQKISWHSFFETRCIYLESVTSNRKSDSGQSMQDYLKNIAVKFHTDPMATTES